MASLRQLLADEGFEKREICRELSKSLRKSWERGYTDEPKALAAYMCNDLRNFDFSKQKITLKTVSSKGSAEFHSRRRRAVSFSERSKCNSLVSGGRGISEEPPIDEVSIRAVISILSGYAGRYIKDEDYRNIIREKCNACLFRRRDDFDNNVIVNLQMGIESIERLLDEQGTSKKQQRLKALKNAIQLLNIVASLNSKNSKKASSVCGIPNSYVSACAQLYLAIVYKIEKNERNSARHLLQVFCDSPCFARTHLLPDLWEHFFLPHLLHLKVWYTKEVEYLTYAEDGEKIKKMKSLSNIYDSHMDKGTTLFALYYKQWLKVGATGPPLPSVPLPSTPNYHKSRRNSADSRPSNSTIKRNLYQAVFGDKIKQQSLDLDLEKIGESWCLETDGESKTEEKSSSCDAMQKFDTNHSERSSFRRQNQEPKLWPESQKIEHHKCFSCRRVPTECLIAGNNISKRTSIGKQPAILSSDFTRAIAAIRSSDILSECESGIRVVTKAWLDLQGDETIEDELSKARVIEGMMEVLSASMDDEILELLISILAVLSRRSDLIGQVILNSDTHLETFMKLLRSNSLFLKAAVLVYLSKPLAKQMISSEWVILALRVLEFGDQLQTLFAVQCYPKVAAYYILDQLLTGFDEDKNLENARLVVSFGGLTMFIKRIETGDIQERNKAALLTYCCIQAEGSCRNFIADNLNMTCLLELIALDSHKSTSSGYAFSILAELLCLNRRTKIQNFLNGLKEGWGGLNVVHILLVYLLKVQSEERPVVAAILFQLDAMEGNMKTSLYSEEAIEAIVRALKCLQCNDKVQQQSARALHMLGGRFSCTGEPNTERWLLDEASFQEKCSASFRSKDMDSGDFIDMNEDEVTENWQRTVALILFKNGDKRLLTALIDSVANGIPQLARASLITVSWMSRYFHLVEDADLKSVTVSIFMPQLIESLNSDKDTEERVLASYSLLCLLRSSGNVSLLGSFNKGTLENLRQLSLVTWTANELLYQLQNLQ